MNLIKENAREILKTMVENQSERFSLAWLCDKMKIKSQDIIDSTEYLETIGAIELKKIKADNAGLIDLVAILLPKGKIIYYDELKPKDITPSIVISRNGKKAIKVEEIDSEWYYINGYAANGIRVVIRKEPNGSTSWVEIRKYSALTTLDDGFGWGIDFNKAFPDIVLMALGEYLY